MSNQINYQKQGLLKTLKPMTWPERIEHIWLNYKIQLALIILIPILLISVLVSIAKNDTNLLVSGIIANVTITEEGSDYINDEFFAYLNGNKDQKDEVRTEQLVFVDLGSTAEIDYNYNIAMNLVNKAHVQTIDYMIMNEYALKFSISQELLMDLREFFTEDELKAFEENGALIKAMREDSTEAIPVAVMISDTNFAKKCITSPSKVYFSIVTQTPRMEACRTFWDYLMSFDE